MPGKFKGDHSFQGDNNMQSGNELASGNHFIFNMNGTPMVMLMGFCLVLAGAAIVWLILSHAGLVEIVVIGGFAVIALAGVGTIITIMICMVFRNISSTRAQLAQDKYRELWARTVYPVGAHVVIADPTTRQLTVHNARDIQEVKHYQDTAQLPAQAATANQPMPSMYELMKDYEA